jgi:S-phase kinase-associated protein 1
MFILQPLFFCVANVANAGPLPPFVFAVHFFSSCKSDILKKVLVYVMKHHEFEVAMASADARHAFDREFIRVADEVLFNLSRAANFLDIKDLLDLACNTYTDRIKECPTPQAIRDRFKIQNDFSPEEEEEVRRENDW